MSNDHKDFLRFLWYNANDLKIVIYRLLRVVFCLTSSPFLLNATIRHHLSKCIQFERNFVEKFLEDLYVDDTTSSAKSIEEGKEFYVKAKKMMAEAGFDLRKWKTNSTVKSYKNILIIKKLLLNVTKKLWMIYHI